ncbi:nitrate reductase [Gymnopilus junonius]|uniref:Nitrate reductase [NADPH] n=1 Tax=Gymnopilus junonius TaxID=109634 RepID=A0A9P5NF76_GYMJU|nr:nitrate reductase [Gymnopilus junonius]
MICRHPYQPLPHQSNPNYRRKMLKKDPKYGVQSLIPPRIPSHLHIPEIPNERAYAEVDALDIGTPDAWIPRDPRLVRLTGKHPFNSEPKLKDLYAQGFLTPSNLFFVRNHGPVPRIDQEKADKWELKIHGLCNNPTTLTLRDLYTKFRVAQGTKHRPKVTRVLWGAGGVSTALFTGVYLADVLEYVQPVRGAKHVIFEGCDDLPNGPYGTSQLLSWAHDPRKGMMLAWAMNGLALSSAPGRALSNGGRSVKWLTRIELSAIESQHHLHFHDNKVLPMPVGPDQARQEKHWWYDPRALCYAGGGHRVTRVELSTDNGTTWDLASVTYPEDAFRSVSYTSDPVYGELDLTESDMCFCWCFWSYEMPVERLKGSSAIMVVRVCIHRLEDDKLQFEHPTMAGTQSGGWMQRLKDEGCDPSNPDFDSDVIGATKPCNAQRAAASPSDVLMTKPGITRKISAAELASAEAKKEAWFIVRGEVYSGSGYFKDHPGEDATEDFIAIHSTDARRQLAEFHIGTFQADDADQNQRGDVTVTTDDDDPTEPFLHPKKWKSVKLVNVRDVSKDAKVFQFALRHETQELGLPIGHHLYVRLRRKCKGMEVLKGELIQRAYTPLLERDSRGVVDLLIKIYGPTPEFPDGGQITQGFAELILGDSIEIKGPIGDFTWKGRGVVSLHNQDQRVTEIGLVCGGTGIAPILQVLRAILNDPRSGPDENEITKVWMVDVNREVDDILCKEEIDQLEKDNEKAFKVYYSLTGRNIPEGWKYSRGRITYDMLKTHLPSPGKGKLVCICGRSEMEQSVKASLSKIGWDESTQVVLF